MKERNHFKSGYQDLVTTKGSEVKCKTSQPTTTSKGKTKAMVVLPSIKGLGGKLRRLLKDMFCCYVCFVGLN